MSALGIDEVKYSEYNAHLLKNIYRLTGISKVEKME